MVEKIKIRITDYPQIKKSVMQIKKIIKLKGVNNIFNPELDRHKGFFGISVKIYDKVVTTWFNKNDLGRLNICCYDGYQIITHLNKSEYYKQKVAYVDVISSRPSKLLTEIQ